MKFLCPHCENGAMRIVAVDGSAVRIECLRCGRESVLDTAPREPSAAGRNPAGVASSGDPGGPVGAAQPAVEARVSATLAL